MVGIRRATAADASFLADMLVEAIDWHAQRSRRKVDLLADPMVARYLKGWKRPTDDGVLALDAQGMPIGACWYRVLPRHEPGHGFVAPGVPELTLGVKPVWRAQGVGRALLQALCAVAAERGHQRISLSVAPANFAQRLYVSEGFVVVPSAGDADTMVRTLR